ncbi:MAG TPA: TRAP transporter small permease [Aquabacterium sp.]|nr:TRAP transporter small permease [Aquabacterium sp.]HQC97143.1 TRAP transporter small permease [Aquabacterium sp.]
MASVTRRPTGPTDHLFRAIDWLLAGLLLAMVVMVFGNVVLRYAFNSGIGVAEELSRFCFIWLTFIGAVSVTRENGHLGMDMLTERLGPGGRRLALVVTQLLVIGSCLMLVWGTWRQHEINATTRAPITDLSLIWVFGISYLTGSCIALLSAHTLWRLLSGRLSDAEIAAMGPRGEEAP